MITKYSDTVRVRTEPCGWTCIDNNVFVEQLIDDLWSTVWATNEVRNGSAYGDAKARAFALVK